MSSRPSHPRTPLPLSITLRNLFPRAAVKSLRSGGRRIQVGQAGQGGQPVGAGADSDAVVSSSRAVDQSLLSSSSSHSSSSSSSSTSSPPTPSLASTLQTQLEASPTSAILENEVEVVEPIENNGEDAFTKDNDSIEESGTEENSDFVDDSKVIEDQEERDEDEENDEVPGNSTITEDRCIFVSREVLIRLRLEIFVKVPLEKSNENEPTIKSEDISTDEETDEGKNNIDHEHLHQQKHHRKSQSADERNAGSKLVYSSKSSQGTAHPRWDHLNEHISILPFNRGIYTDFIRFNSESSRNNSEGGFVGEGGGGSEGEMESDNGGMKNDGVGNDITQSNKPSSWDEWENIYPNLYAKFIIADNLNPVSEKEWTLAEIPLHPTHLRRLPVHNTATNDYNINDVNNNNNRMIIPHSLPPNAILLYYTDGYTRVMPSLYRLLVQRGIVREDAIAIMTTSLSDVGLDIGGDGDWKLGDAGESGGGKGKDASRFSDKAFDVLGGDGKDRKGGKIGDGSGVTPTAAAAFASADIGVPIDKAKIDEMMEAKQRVESSNSNAQQSIFGDDKVFDLLGKAEERKIDTGAHSTAKSSMGPPSVFDDSVFDLVGKPSESTATATSTSTIDRVDRQEDTNVEASRIIPVRESEMPASAMQSEEGVMHTSISIDEKAVDNFLSESQPTSSLPSQSIPNQPVVTPSQTPSPKSEFPHSLSPPLSPLPPMPLHISEGTMDSTTTSSVSQMKNEVEELRRRVQHEQWLLEQEQQAICRDMNHLKYIMSQVQQLEDETSDVMKEIGVEKIKLFRADFRLEAHRIHLLKHLQIILPIKLYSIGTPPGIAAHPPGHPSTHQYYISGVPLPGDVHNPSVPDDQVSTALGFTCHLVALTSKYLAIPMRFRLVCRFSRSAIIDDQAVSGRGNSTSVAYPLFRERGIVDREELDRGMVLLHRNVECLLRVRRIEFRQEWNVLAKMDRLLMQLVEGDDPSFAGSQG